MMTQEQMDEYRVIGTRAVQMPMVEGGSVIVYMVYRLWDLFEMKLSEIGEPQWFLDEKAAIACRDRRNERTPGHPHRVRKVLIPIA
jgi:hypothetical protein